MTQPKRVLSVGNCAFDHGSLSALLEREFQVIVAQAHQADAAWDTLTAEAYDLVLVNRVFDYDGDLGLRFIERVVTDQQLRSVPVMLISNYENSQHEAVKLGAVPGFGKSQLHASATRELLAKYLA